MPCTVCSLDPWVLYCTANLALLNEHALLTLPFNGWWGKHFIALRNHCTFVGQGMGTDVLVLLPAGPLCP